ncbi:MAG: hypothetical protein AAF331_10580, partial [Pseudomonadota bacterium]
MAILNPSNTALSPRARVDLNPGRLHDKILIALEDYADYPFLTTALPTGQTQTTDFKTAIQSAQKLAHYLRRDLGY